MRGLYVILLTCALGLGHILPKGYSDTVVAPSVLLEVLMTNEMICRPEWAIQAHADLMRHEGFRPYAYPDPRSKLGQKYGKKFGYKPATQVLAELGASEKDGMPWTVGYGFTHGVTPASSITREEAAERLWPEVFKHAEMLDRLVPEWGYQPLHVQSVLVNLAFNMGEGTLRKFTTTLKLFNSGKFTEAGHNLKKTAWYKQVGNRAVELTGRLVNGTISSAHKVV